MWKSKRHSKREDIFTIDYIRGKEKSTMKTQIQITSNNRMNSQKGSSEEVEGLTTDDFEVENVLNTHF